MRFLYPLLLIPALCFCQAPAPVISFDKTHHDFGKISPDQKVSHRFIVINKGSAPLQIKEIRPSCGCSYSMVGQWNLKPGEETNIDVHFDPTGMIGNIQKSLSVISNDPQNPDVLLTFEASVIREIMASTMALFFDGISRSGSPVTKTINLQSGDGQQVVVTDAKAPGASYLSCKPVTNGSDVILNVTIDGTKIPTKTLRGVDNLTVRTTNKKEPVFHFHIQWDVQGNIIALPDRLTWVETAGQKMSAVVTISNRADKPFRILEAKSTSPLITTPNLPKNSATEHKIEVELSSKAKAGGYRELITLKLDDPEQEIVEIAIVAVLR
ncbi:MAG: DUF1573 domain-containing protein [Holophagaceae bacterium]|nr:DUF1573 domain-containing protein [Holophagaceae bacterium]